MGTLHNKLYSIINQIMRMGTLHITLYRLNISDYENGYTAVHSTLYRFNKSDFENGYTKQYTV